MRISYRNYLDRILGGWIGKSLGGALGARFEGCKAWIELSVDEIVPDELPPNDDLDLQVVWLKALEEKGISLTSDDLAEAWLEGCSYSANEYAAFRRNYRLGIKPPYTGSHNNHRFEAGMGCPIRSEIWGYVFPGAPDWAARYAWMDGTLDHTDESVCPEMMYSAMAADAFFESDIRRLAEKHFHYLEPGLLVTRLVESAFRSYDRGLSLREARERILLLGGRPEQCDARVNVPFTFLALLYGQNDLEQTLLSALKCGYDTDCTLATAGAFVGQILGAGRIPRKLRDIVGDELVMGIEYRRKEMTLSALARDTATMGLRLNEAAGLGIDIAGAPEFKPLAGKHRVARPRIEVRYGAAPSVAPGQSLPVELIVKDARGHNAPARLEIETPPNWEAVPKRVPVRLTDDGDIVSPVTLYASPKAKRWPQGHHFAARVAQNGRTVIEEPFGVAGAMMWRALSVHFDPCVPEGPNGEVTREQIMAGGMRARCHRRYHIDLDRDYIDEGAAAKSARAADPLYESTTRLVGKPAVVLCPDNFIRPEQVFGIRGECVFYLDAEFVSPAERECWFWISSNDAYRIYLNGKVAKEQRDMRWWAPEGGQEPLAMRKGRNRLLLKLYRRSDDLKFHFGIRLPTGVFEDRVTNDWATDLEWLTPE